MLLRFPACTNVVIFSLLGEGGEVIFPRQ